MYLRKGEPFAQVGAKFDISTATCWREKMAYVMIDGTLVPIDRIAADRPFYAFVSGLIRADHGEIGSVWRALDPGQQALLVLVYLRKGEPFVDVGAGFGVSTTTCWRYVTETVELLAARALRLRAALREASRKGDA